MRTTVDIEAPVLKELKEIQKREGVTSGAFEWTARPMRPRIDLADEEAVHAILDRPADEP